MASDSNFMLLASIGCGVLLFLLLIVVLFAFVANRRAAHSAERTRLFGSTIKEPPAWVSRVPFGQASIPIQPAAQVIDESESDADSDQVDRRTSAGYMVAQQQPQTPLSPSIQRAKKQSLGEGLSRHTMRWPSVDFGADSTDDTTMGYVSSCESGSSTGGGRPVWRIWFKVVHDADSKLLTVTLFRTKCIPAQFVDTPSTEVYVSLMLIPGEHVQQTQTYPNTGSPSFDETFTFPLAVDELAGTQLRLSLYDVDASRTRLCFGHCVLRLADVGLESDQPVYMEKDLQPLGNIVNAATPEVNVTLAYHPERERLKVQLVDVRNVPADTEMDRFYVRMQIRVGNKLVKVKRTHSAQGLAKSVNCSYAFEVPMKHLEHCCVQFVVICISDGEAGHSHGGGGASSDSDCRETNSNELDLRDGEWVYGRVTLGPITYTHGSGNDHWKQMMQNVRKTVEHWHMLADVKPRRET